MARIAATAALLGACGARTPLDLGDDHGGGGGPPLQVHCTVEGGGVTAPGESLEIEARAEGGGAPTFLGWDVVLEPAGSVVEPDAPDAPRTTFTPERIGGYRLRATFRDGAVHESCSLDIRVDTRPVAECDDARLTTPAGSSVVLTVDAAGAEPLTYRWVVESAPPGSLAAPDSPERSTTTFRPDLVGLYTLGAQVRDRFGQSAACNVQVEATPDPPRLECDDVETTPLTEVTLRARYSGEGTPVAWAWTLRSTPDGSSASPPAPEDDSSPRFTPDLAGDYIVEVGVENNLREAFVCVLTVAAFPTEALRVEMFWNPPDRSCDGRRDGCDDSDVDLHLLHPDGDAWFDSNDCHWRNCEGGLSWDGPGEDDDPFLDLDDTDGFGPENINVDTPADGTFRIGVHYYGDGDAWDRPAQVTVRIYCGDALPVEFGPQALTADDVDSSQNDFWKVADVSFSRGACVLDALGQVVSELEARNSR